MLKKCPDGTRNLSVLTYCIDSIAACKYYSVVYKIGRYIFFLVYSSRKMIEIANHEQLFILRNICHNNKCTTLGVSYVYR